MRTTRFNCSEGQLCAIAGVQFEKLTPTQRNNARILSMYFSTPETYHADVIDEVRSFATNIDLVIGDAAIEQGVTYYSITAANAVTPQIVKPSVDEMTTKISDRLKIPDVVVKSWDIQYVESAFASLGMMPRNRTDSKITGYLMVDANAEYPRFKASAADCSYVVQQFLDYVEQQKAKIAAPVVTTSVT